MTATTETGPEGEAAGLLAGVDRLTEKLGETLVTREEFERNRRNVRIGLALAALGFAGVIVALVLLASVVTTNRRLVDDLSECTTPTPPADVGEDPHECYEDGQARQRSAVDGLRRGIGEDLDDLGDRVVREIRRSG